MTEVKFVFASGLAQLSFVSDHSGEGIILSVGGRSMVLSPAEWRDLCSAMRGFGAYFSEQTRNKEQVPVRNDGSE